jgi:farnesyl-diphosphate farnesyltransferase
VIAPALRPEAAARLLARTSRTFALAIPLLDEPLRSHVGLSYLLFRIADTLEDGSLWPTDRRHEALLGFAGWIAGGDARWLAAATADPPTADEGCLELLRDAERVLATVRSWPREGALILEHTGRTARGMARFLATAGPRGEIALPDLDALRRYAYVVAGLVGELLTALFAAAIPEIAAARAELDVDAAAFGEGLQLVNILKDAPDDRAEGRVYLPAGVARASVVALAREDLERAGRYVDVLRGAGAPAGITAFCELPRRLGVATLDALDRGERRLSREEVLRVWASVKPAA